MRQFFRPLVTCFYLNMGSFSLISPALRQDKRLWPLILLLGSLRPKFSLLVLRAPTWKWFPNVKLMRNCGAAIVPKNVNKMNMQKICRHSNHVARAVWVSKARYLQLQLFITIISRTSIPPKLVGLPLCQTKVRIWSTILLPIPFPQHSFRSFISDLVANKIAHVISTVIYGPSIPRHLRSWLADAQ